MEKRSVIYVLSMMLLLLSSCSHEEMVGDDTQGDLSGVEVGPLVEVPCEFVIQDFNGLDSKAPSDPEPYSDNEKTLNNFWLLQFGQTTGAEENRPFLAAVYHDNSESPWGVQWVRMSENHLASTGLVWIVANIGETDVNGKKFFSDYAGKTLGDFYADGMPLSDMDQLKLLNDGQSCLASWDATLAIPLSGSCYFDVDDLIGVDDRKGIKIGLRSIVAKLTVDATGVEEAVSFTLFGVPSKVSFAPEKVAVTRYKPLLYEYPVLPSGKKFTLYVPQNIPMTTTASETQVSSGTASTKTANAPANAMYLSIGVSHSGKSLAVNVFPGTDEKDYKVRANTRYYENVTASASTYTTYLDDNKKDSRLVEKRVETEKSNCYMIHPIYQGASTSLYSSINREETYVLPFVDRVNEAWSGNSTNTIGADDEWIIHQLWQDESKRLVYLAQSSGLAAWDINAAAYDDYAYEYYGRGLSNVYVAAVRSNSESYTRGNVVLAIRKKTAGGSYVAGNGQRYGDILWSWHLWVTDYEPDQAESWSSGYYEPVNGVSGSKVFHYKYWGNSYQWIMDRHIGAKGWKPAVRYDESLSISKQTQLKKSAAGYGLFYQWGRKDPFPGRGAANGDLIGNNLYDLEGKSISNPITSQIKNYSILQTSAVPTTLIGYDSSVSGIQYDGKGYNWRNPVNNSSKSLYDPCPPGWEVTPYQVFYGNGAGIVNSLRVPGTSTSSGDIDYTTGQYATMNYNYLYQYGYNNYEAYAIDVSGGKGSNKENLTYYPVTGFVSRSGSRDLGGLCDLWTAESKSVDCASYLYIGRALTFVSGDRVYPIAHLYGENNAAYFSKHHAFTVRCVKK